VEFLFITLLKSWYDARLKRKQTIMHI